MPGTFGGSWTRKTPTSLRNADKSAMLPMANATADDPDDPSGIQ
jgi:hypothetical protein